MRIFEMLTAKQMQYLPDLPDHMLTQMGYVRQKVKLFCKETCRDLTPAYPDYQGDGMYSLVCLNCGDTLLTDVDADKLFVDAHDNMFNEPNYHMRDNSQPVYDKDWNVVGRRSGNGE